MLAVAAPCSCSWTGRIRWIRTDCPAIFDPFGPPEILTTDYNIIGIKILLAINVTLVRKKMGLILESPWIPLRMSGR